MNSCEVSLGSTIKADSATLHIANNHWWPYIKFEVQGLASAGWEVKQTYVQIAGGAATHEVDFSSITDASEFKLVGNKAFCDFVNSISIDGVNVDPYAQALKECQLIVVNVHGECTHAFPGLDEQVDYAEPGTGGLSLGLEGHGQD